MKKMIIAIAMLCLFCGSALAADYCDTKYMKYINKLKEDTRIMDEMKQKYIPYLEKARSLCKQDKMEEARRVMNEVKDMFFDDALMNQRSFYGN